AAGSSVAGSVGGLPGASVFTGATLFRSGVGHGADNRDGGGAAVVRRGRRIKGPGGAQFDRLVSAAASNHRCGGVHHSDLLAAGSAVATSGLRLPGVGSTKAVSGMTGRVG